jgi:hypothetical protein
MIVLLFPCFRAFYFSKHLIVDILLVFTRLKEYSLR